MELIDLLYTHQKSRERSNKYKAIAVVLKSHYPKIEDMDVERVADIVAEAISLDRQWRKILEDNISLRGSDYNQGKTLAQKKQIELGYTPGHEADLKRLRSIT